jgi:hypothetical protein
MPQDPSIKQQGAPPAGIGQYMTTQVLGGGAWPASSCALKGDPVVSSEAHAAAVPSTNKPDASRANVRVAMRFIRISPSSERVARLGGAWCELVRESDSDDNSLRRYCASCPAWTCGAASALGASCAVAARTMHRQSTLFRDATRYNAGVQMRGSRSRARVLSTVRAHLAVQAERHRLCEGGWTPFAHRPNAGAGAQKESALLAGATLD